MQEALWLAQNTCAVGEMWYTLLEIIGYLPDQIILIQKVV